MIGTGPRRAQRFALTLGLALGALASPLGAGSARAQMPAPQPTKSPSGFSQPTRPSSKLSTLFDRHLELSGYLRVRIDTLANLDLNHGPTPTTGRPLFPTPLSGSGDALTSSDMRVRLEPTIRVGWGVSLHFRVDVLDNLVLGSTPDGLPISVGAPISGGSTSQNPPESGKNALVDSIRVKRAWGQVVLPLGVLSAGRMGSLIDWGTGFFINSGSCLDCDLGDVGDRISFVMPIFDQLVGFAFDFGASGPTSSTLRVDAQPFDLERRDDVRSYALMITNYQTPNVLERYRRAGRLTLLYGFVGALRTQEDDVPAYYLTGKLDRPYGKSDLVHRGILAFAADLWLGLRYRGLTIDVELATVISRVENASLLPGTEFLRTVTARQFGGVARIEQRWPRLSLRFESGLASGDRAPGFGVRPPLDQVSSQPGDLDGPQVALPGDTTIDNFRFNPDYRIDQILWRRIIGTVTDAVYLKPSASWRPLRGLSLDVALISSLALEATSTPSGRRPLGVELNLGARYRLEPYFELSATYAVLFPLAGLRNERLGFDPEPAHLLHVVLAFLL